MAEAEQIYARIEELERQLEEVEQAENQFQSGDMVNFTDDNGEEGVAMVESVAEDQLSIRVMAVAGDTFEPTDDVLTVDGSSVTPMDSDSENEDDDESDDEPDVEVNEEDLEKGLFVSWISKTGLTVGRIADIAKDQVVIPETGDVYECSDKTHALIDVFEKYNEKYEDTGVSVAIPCDSLKTIEPLDVRARQIMMKVKNAEIEYDEEKNIGWLKGIGSAYGKVDLGGDTISKGAYTQTIKHNDGKIQLSVDHGFRVKDVVGVAYIEDSEEGLYTKSKMPLHIPHVKDAYEMAKFMLSEGKPLGYSIEYNTIKSEPLPNGVRDLKEIALDGMTITPWPMDTHARIRDAKSRKITYNAKRRAWQTLKKSTKPTDAPTGNQHDEGDRKSLDLEIRQLKDQLKQELIT